MLGDFLVKALRKPAEASASKQGILSKILRIGKKNDEHTAAPPVNPKDIYVLRCDDTGPLNFMTADCCSPIPGDDTLGFITDSGAVEIHTLDCPRAQVLKAGYGPRIVATRWENSGARFVADIRIEGIDRHGILQELIQMISTHLAIDIRRLNIEAKGEIFTCELSVKVASADVVRDLCNKALTINGIKTASRIQ